MNSFMVLECWSNKKASSWALRWTFYTLFWHFIDRQETYLLPKQKQHIALRQFAAMTVWQYLMQKYINISPLAAICFTVYIKEPNWSWRLFSLLLRLWISKTFHGFRENTDNYFYYLFLYKNDYLVLNNSFSHRGMLWSTVAEYRKFCEGWMEK